MLRTPWGKALRLAKRVPAVPQDGDNNSRPATSRTRAPRAMAFTAGGPKPVKLTSSLPPASKGSDCAGPMSFTTSTSKPAVAKYPDSYATKNGHMERWLDAETRSFIRDALDAGRVQESRTAATAKTGIVRNVLRSMIGLHFRTQQVQRKHFPAPRRERFGDDGLEAVRMGPDARCQGTSIAAANFTQQKVAHRGNRFGAGTRTDTEFQLRLPGAVVLHKLVIARAAAEALRQRAFQNAHDIAAHQRDALAGEISITVDIAHPPIHPGARVFAVASNWFENARVIHLGVDQKPRGERQQIGEHARVHFHVGQWRTPPAADYGHPITVHVYAVAGAHAAARAPDPSHLGDAQPWRHAQHEAHQAAAGHTYEQAQAGARQCGGESASQFATRQQRREGCAELRRRRKKNRVQNAACRQDLPAGEQPRYQPEPRSDEPDESHETQT